MFVMGKGFARASKSREQLSEEMEHGSTPTNVQIWIVLLTMVYCRYLMAGLTIDSLI